MNFKDMFLRYNVDRIIRCAIIQDFTKKPKKFILKEGYTPDDYEKFLQEINFTVKMFVDIFATVWYIDGTWMEVYPHYDSGMLDWEYRQYPEIPEELLEG